MRRRTFAKLSLAALATKYLSACGSGSSSSSTPTPIVADEWFATKYDDPTKKQMQVLLNGYDNGTHRIVYFQHTKDGIDTMPYVAGIDASGKIQLQFLNATDNPFGASLILGPIYWRNDVTGDSYQANPTISKLEIIGSMHSGPLDLKLTGTSGDGSTPDFNAVWDIKMYQPQLNDNKMILDITQTLTCAQNLSLSGTKYAEYRHFMTAMLRSMYADADTHYSNAVRFIKSDDTIENKNLADMIASGLLFDGLTPSYRVGEMTHTDDSNGNTPNVRIQLLSPAIPSEHQWQGAYLIDSNPLHDNVEAGFNHKTAPLIWATNDVHTTKYRLIASDNPIDPSMPDADPI